LELHLKRLVFCFDGTWNRLDAAYSTNVVITAESILPLTANNTAQLIYYDEGVGTTRLDRIRGGMFGIGLVQNLADAYRYLIFNYSAGDEIFVFGFSRGAYTARSFAGLLSNCGILLRKDAGKVKEAIERYRERTDTESFIEKMMCFRRDHSPSVCVSVKEDQWRAGNIPGYNLGSAPLLRIKYLGVWDTVGALGIPAQYKWLSWVNKKHQFHDTNLSPFVQNARHAVAIDERRKDFAPTLWSNLEVLNSRAGVNAEDPPYQQKWFPGTHSSVGGGGERRGLSDQALDWILDGARNAGLEFDSTEYSRIFELKPDYTEYLENSQKSGLLYRVMNRFSADDRMPGPNELRDVSISARRRWHEKQENLKGKATYRPATLNATKVAIEALDPATIGIGKKTPAKDIEHTLYQVKRGDALRKIAKDLLGDANADTSIFQANLDKLESKDRIYVGQLLKIPKIRKRPKRKSSTAPGKS